MEQEEIILAFVEGFLRQAIGVVDEMSCGMYSVSFEIEKTQIGGSNN